jgi:hypothetical protein
MRRETAELTGKATELGIEIPEGHSDWWWFDEECWGGKSQEEIELGACDDSWYLTQKGKAGLRKLIRDERRKNLSWWLEAVAKLITLLVGLIGSLIGVLAFVKK